MMTKFRKGDVVTIEVVVDSNPFGENDVRVRQPGGYSDIYTKASSLTMVKPLIEVGDRVTWSTPDGVDCFTGDVLSISGEHLWIQLDSGNYATVWSGKAMRVDPEPEEQTIVTGDIVKSEAA